MKVNKSMLALTRSSLFNVGQIVQPTFGLGYLSDCLPGMDVWGTYQAGDCNTCISNLFGREPHAGFISDV